MDQNGYSSFDFQGNVNPNYYLPSQEQLNYQFQQQQQFQLQKQQLQQQNLVPQQFQPFSPYYQPQTKLQPSYPNDNQKKFLQSNNQCPPEFESEERFLSQEIVNNIKTPFQDLELLRKLKSDILLGLYPQFVRSRPSQSLQDRMDTASNQDTHDQENSIHPPLILPAFLPTRPNFAQTNAAVDTAAGPSRNLPQIPKGPKVPNSPGNKKNSAKKKRKQAAKETRGQMKDREAKDLVEKKELQRIQVAVAEALRKGKENGLNMNMELADSNSIGGDDLIVTSLRSTPNDLDSRRQKLNAQAPEFNACVASEVILPPPFSPPPPPPPPPLLPYSSTLQFNPFHPPQNQQLFNQSQSFMIHPPNHLVHEEPAYVTIINPNRHYIPLPLPQPPSIPQPMQPPPPPLPPPQHQQQQQQQDFSTSSEDAFIPLTSKGDQDDRWGKMVAKTKLAQKSIDRQTKSAAPNRDFGSRSGSLSPNTRRSRSRSPPPRLRSRSPPLPPPRNFSFNSPRSQPVHLEDRYASRRSRDQSREPSGPPPSRMNNNLHYKTSRDDRFSQGSSSSNNSLNHRLDTFDQYRLGSSRIADDRRNSSVNSFERSQRSFDRSDSPRSARAMSPDYFDNYDDRSRQGTNSFSRQDSSPGSSRLDSLDLRSQDSIFREYSHRFYQDDQSRSQRPLSQHFGFGQDDGFLSQQDYDDRERYDSRFATPNSNHSSRQASFEPNEDRFNRPIYFPSVSSHIPTSMNQSNEAPLSARLSVGLNGGGRGRSVGNNSPLQSSPSVPSVPPPPLQTRFGQNIRNNSSSTSSNQRNEILKL